MSGGNALRNEPRTRYLPTPTPAPRGPDVGPRVRGDSLLDAGVLETNPSGDSLVKMNFEEEVWQYTDVYDKSVLHGPVSFPKLRSLWRQGHIGPSTTVFNETWLDRPVAVKRVKGLMTALSQKDEAPRRAAGGGGDPPGAMAAEGRGIDDQLWYCQMPNGDVVGPLKTLTLQRLWLDGRVGAQYLVRAKSSSTWPSNRTYTVSGLMQALELFRGQPDETREQKARLSERRQQRVPDIPQALLTPPRRPAGGADGAASATISPDEPISAVKEVVITLPNRRPHHHNHAAAAGRSSSRRGSQSSRRAEKAEVSTTVEPDSSTTTTTTMTTTATGSSLRSASPEASEATSSTAAAPPPAALPSRRRQGHRRRRRSESAGGGIDAAAKLEEANAQIKRLAHSLAQSEKEKIQAREVALSLRTMLLDERKRVRKPPAPTPALPKSPYVENSAPEHSLELKKLSHMSTDSLFTYASNLRAENEKLLSIRKEIVDAHQSRERERSGHEGARSVTPVPFNISPSVPVSAGGAGVGAARSAPTAPREAYEPTTRSVHAESLVGPAHSPFGGGLGPTDVGSYHLRRGSESSGGPCDCTKPGSPLGAPTSSHQDAMLDDIEREIELFLTPREGPQGSAREVRLDDDANLPPRSQAAAPQRDVRALDHHEASGSEAGDGFTFPKTPAHARSDSLESSGGGGGHAWSGGVTVARHQPRAKRVDEAVETFVRKFRENGFLLPLSYQDGFGYSLSGKKVHLAVFGTKLHVRFGGGYIDFRDYLDQKKTVLQELARPKGERTPQPQAGGEEDQEQDAKPKQE